jgi:toxin FitB
MIILDTNIISEMGKPRPSETVVRWFAASNPSELFLCDITLMELAYGAEKHLLKHGSNKYHISLEGLIRNQFRDHTIDCSQSASLTAGYVRARREMAGRMITVQDSMIAAICLTHGARLATRNVRDFEGLDLALINPFEER